MEQIKKAIVDAYTGNAGDHDVLRLDAYIADAVKTESPMDKPIKTDPVALNAAIDVLRAAGKFADQIRKLVIYESDKVTVETLDNAAVAIEDATDAFITSLYREIAEEYSGEEVKMNRRLLHAALGSLGEQAEKLELLKEQAQNGGIMNWGKYILESGDGCWFQATEFAELQARTAFGPGAIMTANRDKLAVRLQGGKFDLDTFYKRDESAEEKAALGKAA